MSSLYYSHLSLAILIIISMSIFESQTIIAQNFTIEESSIQDLQVALKNNSITSRQLVEFYLNQIEKHNPTLNAVIEVNPDALDLADLSDQARRNGTMCLLGTLHGIPVLVNDLFATKDKLNTSAGSFALLNSVVPRDAGVVKKLRDAGAIILGKASLSEWSNFRSLNIPNGWSARGGQGKNPYVLSADICGSSTGSAISVAANMVAVSLGTETDGAILCPASFTSVVGFKPTVGLTSRAGVIPKSSRQDSVGPIARTVADAVYVLDAIVGFDANDAITTQEASRYIPSGGYTQFLKLDGVNGKRIGILRNQLFNFYDGNISEAHEYHFETLRQKGATLVDNLEIADLDKIMDGNVTAESILLLAEFEISINAYLQDLVSSPIRSLSDIIEFNLKFAHLEKTRQFGQEIFLLAERTNGFREAEKRALINITMLTKNGFEKVMKDNNLDAIISPSADIAPVLAIGGFPGINVPAGYDENGVPFGISFGGVKGSEPKLIEIAYGFEQATKVRKPPSFKP